MRLAPTRKEEKGKVTVVLSCPKCGHKKRGVKKVVGTSKVPDHDPPERVVVIGKEDQKLRTLPTARAECPKCSNMLAYVWQVQTRGSDESSTQFFRCTKCDYTFREYS